ncbi:putative reductase [Agrobacterium sp. NCPPB 925]|uniref:NAD-dependent epimerase/dehydratase family protein n=1 Tax=Agrobacterium genomosp. 6 TaxID=1183411 RepID=UPI0009CD3EEF|nr:NAD-dependent epimerase/dehydratase family protein [Agrobacterium genomosp. 6]CUX71434.1 putative reductase [Agrobacterium sp. NCPPB 925]
MLRSPDTIKQQETDVTKQAFIIGGTGQIGRAIGLKLLKEGWGVTFASRIGNIPDEALGFEAKAISLDRDQPGALGRAIGTGADAVIDTVAYDETHANQLLDIQASVGQFVVISSSSVYRDKTGRTLDEARENGFPDLPDGMTEDQPTVEPGPQNYSTKKVAVERLLLDGAKRPVTILRPAAIHGTHSTHPREWWFVKRMMDGREIIPLCFNGRSRFHTTAARNIAEVTWRALAANRKLILNIADPVAPTVHEIGSHIAEAMGWTGTLLPIDMGDPRLGSPVGWTPWSVPAPFTLNTDAARQIGYTAATDYSRSVAATCHWLRSSADKDWRERFPILARYTVPLFDYDAEDAFLRTYRVPI